VVTGDRVSVHSSRGGGWGSPLEREPELAARDKMLGYLSADKTRGVYGGGAGKGWHRGPEGHTGPA
jgi:N-methylhydantoinase B